MIGVECLLPTHCYALDIYDAPPAPPGLFFSDYPLYYTADKTTDKDGDTAINDLGLRSYQNLFRLTYSTKSLFNKNTFVFDAILPVGRVEILGESEEGLGDILTIFGYYFIDEPKSGTYFAPAFYIDVPTGEYDKGRTVNLGSNVWQFRPALFFSKYHKRMNYDIALKYTMYTENSDTKVRSGNEIILETLLGYSIKLSLVLAAHLDATWGDDAEVDGHRLDDSGVQVYKSGVSLDWALDEKTFLDFKYLREFNTKNTPEGDLFQVRFSIKLW
ncbi:MAG: transporter [Candidatus Thiodiazotropha sp. (ex Dulcina madagascariensis)]|nr:transporter [Candidatus Thiodiazotropha sp. (ex Dulcina madagascariensis)]